MRGWDKDVPDATLHELVDLAEARSDQRQLQSRHASSS